MRGFTTKIKLSLFNHKYLSRDISAGSTRVSTKNGIVYIVALLIIQRQKIKIIDLIKNIDDVKEIRSDLEPTAASTHE